jgi:hypothetical protein
VCGKCGGEMRGVTLESGNCLRLRRDAGELRRKGVWGFLVGRDSRGSAGDDWESGTVRSE